MLDTPLRNRAGVAIVGPDNEPFTLRHALYTAIDAQMEDDARMEPGAKLKLAKLSLKLANDKAELTAGDTTILLERAAKTLSVLVYAQLVLALDPKSLD
jgi:hypothetical protein